MRLSSVLFTTGVCLVLAAPTAASQGRLSADLFFARNGALVPGSSLYGLGLTLSGGALAIRASGAAAFSSRSSDEGEAVGIDAWTGEVDLLLQPAIFGGAGTVAFSPYLFGGIGRVARNDFDGFGFDERWTAGSYGAGLALPLGRALGVNAEARYRLPLAEALDEDQSQVDSSFPRGWEYRFGLSIRLGG